MKCLSAPFLLLALACHGAAAAAAVPTRPNVLFIAIDDLRTALGCYGDPLVKSPNIDRLAQSGRMFTAAYTQQAVCGPARASLMTGKLPDNIRVWHNRNLFRDTLPDVVTLPQMFMRNGYHAASMGKTFSGDPREEDPQSWSVPFILKQEGWRNYALPENQANEGKGPSHEMADVPDNGYGDGKLAELAVKTLHDLKAKGQPFFLAVGFFKPHLPFNAPKKYWDLYDPAVFDLENEIPRVSAAPKEAYHTHRELGGYTDMPGDEQLSAAQTRTMRHGYYACVSYTDAQVGKLLDTLDELGLADNTIVVLWGDHGYSLGEANRWCKGTNFELDTRVPLMVRVPGMESPGQATQALVELVDIYPTLAELAGLQPPAGLDGRSFAAVLRDPAQQHRDAVQSQFARPFKKSAPEVMGYSIRTPQYRYGRWVDFKTRQTVAEELYDYADAASVTARAEYRIENTNKVADPALAGVLDAMRARLDSDLAGRVDQPDAAAKADGEKKKS